MLSFACISFSILQFLYFVILQFQPTVTYSFYFFFLEFFAIEIYCFFFLVLLESYTYTESFQQLYIASPEKFYSICVLFFHLEEILKRVTRSQFLEAH